MTRRKRESVHATFHYLVRQTKDEAGNLHTSGFSEQDFENIANSLEKFPELDLKDEEILDRIRFRNLVPIEDAVRLDERTIFGRYRAPYWGHAYDNTAVGKIPRESISLRPFFFLLYFAKSGRIYIGAQYLGQFGSYSGLKKIVISLLEEKRGVIAHSFRRDSVGVGDFVAKEIKVNISRRPESIDGRGKFAQRAVLTFPSVQGDPEMQQRVKNRLVPMLGDGRAGIQKEIAELLRDSALTDVQDDEIEGVSVVADVNGRSKTIQFIGAGMYPSQFPLDVSFDSDGHPTRRSTEVAMLAVFENDILSIKENE